MEADVIKREFIRDVNLSEKHQADMLGATIGVLKLACRTDSVYRKVLMELCGKSSTKELTGPEWYALQSFVQAHKPEGGKWCSARGDDLALMCEILAAV